MWRFILALLMGTMGSAPGLPAQEESAALLQLEKEMLTRIAARAVATGGFRFGSGEFDLRLPLKGEPEEIIGPTVNAAGSVATGSARIEPLDSIASRDSTFIRARYALRLEDRRGNCRVVFHELAFDSAVVNARRETERCHPLYMAEVVRRARRIVRLPLSAGNLDDHWSAALAATGTADVYMDSVVVTTSTIAVRASYPAPATELVRIDSISAALASGETSWSIVRRSPAIPVDTTLRKGGVWRRQIRRFVIPVDPDDDLSRSWPVFEIYLRVPVTADNPSGIAWTYAHGKKGFFQHPTLPRRR